MSFEKYDKFRLKDGRTGWIIEIFDQGKSIMFELEKKGMDDKIIDITAYELEEKISWFFPRLKKNFYIVPIKLKNRYKTSLHKEWRFFVSKKGDKVHGIKWKRFTLYGKTASGRVL